MKSAESAALIRVSEGPAQILVTVYQANSAPSEAAPRLRVVRLGGGADRGPRVDIAAQPEPNTAAMTGAEVIAHVQRIGDVAAKIGDWIGQRGSRLWIEGFSLTPSDGVKSADVEYQAVLGRGWLSPWFEGGKFCGSRGMALPLLGLKLRLKGKAVKTHECSYAATFVDGSSVGPVMADHPCEAKSLAALEAFQIVIRRRGKEPASARAPVRKRSR
jgi:hypothetical protein